MPWAEQWRRLDPDACSVARTVATIGDRWTLLVLRDAFNGVSRFAAFRQRLGIPPTVLSDRLSQLVEAGVLARHTYQDAGQRSRHEYKLTPKGEDLRPVLISLLAFGDKHLSGREGAPLVLTHRNCGEPVALELRCLAGHQVDGRHLRSIPGPGARYLST